MMAVTNAYLRSPCVFEVTTNQGAMRCFVESSGTNDVFLPKNQERDKPWPTFFKTHLFHRISAVPHIYYSLQYFKPYNSPNNIFQDSSHSLFCKPVNQTHPYFFQRTVLTRQLNRVDPNIDFHPRYQNTNPNLPPLIELINRHESPEEVLILCHVCIKLGLQFYVHI